MQLFKATFVKNECNFFRILVQKKLALIISFRIFEIFFGELHNFAFMKTYEASFKDGTISEKKTPKLTTSQQLHVKPNVQVTETILISIKSDSPYSISESYQNQSWLKVL